MGATYTRQSASAIVDGGVIEASDINAEFNQVLAAFAVTSGHTHDGTAAEGGPITKLLGTAITIGDATAGTDIAVTFDGESADGVLTWMEDEDYFQFSDDLLLTTTEKLQFRDTAIYINSSADGQLDLVADTEIQIAATTVDINGAVALNGAITGATNITLSGELDAATLDISGNADIDGTLEADAITINGTAIGSIYGVIAGSSSIVTTGALDSGSITSGFGTIDTGSSTITTTGLISGGSLDIDNVLINGTTIGHTDDTDLMTVADGVLTVAGELDATTLDISGNADIDGTTNLDAVDIDGAVQLDATFTVGADDQGYDVKLFGDTASAYMLWDTSADDLILGGAAGFIVPDGQFTLGSTAVSATAAEINLIDGGTSRGTTAVADGDGLLVNDDGTMRMTNVTTLKTYFQTGISMAADDIGTGDGAVTIATSSGNITIDTQAGDADIIFKGTDSAADITALTLDMSAAGLAIFNDSVTVGDNLNLTTDSAVINFGADSDTTLTHTDGTGLTLNSTNKLCFNDATQFIQGASGTVLDIAATDEIELTATLIDVVGNLAGSGTATFGGILKTDDATEATSTTDGSLQTDGGLSVVKDVILGDDVTLLSDAAVLKFGADAEVTLTHVHNDGLLLNTDMQLQFRDSAINIRSDADGDLDINADDEVEINSTLIDINGNVEMSGTLTQSGVATFSVAANVAQVALSSSSNAIAWDASAAANAYHVTTENTTFSAPSNAVEGAFICVEINYNGSHTIAFNTVFEFAASTAPTTTDTDGKTDILVFRYNGAVWQEVGRTLNLAES